jgi:hypothetical protein
VIYRARIRLQFPAVLTWIGVATPNYDQISKEASEELKKLIRVGAIPMKWIGVPQPLKDIERKKADRKQRRWRVFGRR